MRGDDERRPSRPPQPDRVVGPEVPDDVQFADLDRSVRGRLRTLSKDNAEQVGRHLVMTGRLLDTDPELAYEHAQAAVRRAGRVDVVREAAGLAAYRTGRFAEALRELRTVRRLNGSSEHLAVMADCERGLGRPERALTLAASQEAESLDPDVRVELAMVVSGARLDLGEPEAALATLSTPAISGAVPAEGLLAARVAQARAAALEALGRHDDAAAALAPFSVADLAEAAGEVEDDVVVWDLADDAEGDLDPSPDAHVDGAAGAEPATETDATIEADAAGRTDAGTEADGAEADATTEATTRGASGVAAEYDPDAPHGEDLGAAADVLAKAQSEGADVETPTPAGGEAGESRADVPSGEAGTGTPDEEDHA